MRTLTFRDMTNKTQKETDAALLESLGLSGGQCMLLPSFMECLRGLTTQGRTFSVCFRTFGQ